MMQRAIDSVHLVVPFTHRLDGFDYANECSPARYVSRKALELGSWLIDHV